MEAGKSGVDIDTLITPVLALLLAVIFSMEKLSKLGFGWVQG